jgi:molecular chaperone DnaK
VTEGENKKADRNQLIGYLEILPSQIKRDVPAGSEIEITIEIDRSRLVKTKAYIPVLDEEFEKVLKMEKAAPDPAAMKTQIEAEKRRLAKVQAKAEQTGNEEVLPIIARIEDERMMQAVEASLDAAQVDQDAAQKCEKSLLDLKAAVDDLEDALEIPALLAEARQTIEYAEKIVEAHGKAEEQRMLLALKRELKAAMEARTPDPDEIRRKTEQLDTLRMRVLTGQPSWWVDYLTYLEELQQEMTDQARANQLITRGRRAINNNDLEDLKSTCRQLVQLLTPEQQELARGYGGTIG